jgi:hypothetical protein
MTTLIGVYNSDGCVGRCDAKCYEAQGGDCHCICGGMNHGKGEAAAREQTRQLSGAMLRDIEARGGWIAEDLRQGNLL